MAGVAEAGVDGGGGEVEDGGDFLAGEALVVVEDDGEAVFFVELVYRGPEVGALLAVGDEVVYGGGGGGPAAQPVEGEGAADFLAAQAVAADVDGDGGEPGLEGGFVAIAADLLKDAEEGFLDGVFGFFLVAEDGEGEAVDGRLLALE